MEGPVVSVQLHALRAGSSTENLHQTVETCSRVSSTVGCENSDLLGRHDSVESGSDGIENRHELPTLLADAIRLCYQLEEVRSDSDPDLGFLGVHNKYCGDENLPTPRQGNQGDQQVSETDICPDSKSQRTGRSDRVTNLIGEGHLTGPPSLQAAPNGTGQGPIIQSVVRGQDSVVGGGNWGAAVVGPEHSDLEWEDYNNTFSGPISGYGRVPPRMGGSLGVPQDRGGPGARRRDVVISMYWSSKGLSSQ